MDIKAYIESGILELYVAGQLSEKENQDVKENQNPNEMRRMYFLDNQTSNNLPFQFTSTEIYKTPKEGNWGPTAFS